MPEPLESTCRICGCTETTPCVFEDHRGEPFACHWVEEDLCSNPDCVAQVIAQEVEAEPMVQLCSDGDATAFLRERGYLMRGER